MNERKNTVDSPALSKLHHSGTDTRTPSFRHQGCL